jgi:hypothetical protein
MIPSSQCTNELMNEWTNALNIVHCSLSIGAGGDLC